jgi:hypothetical protein
MTKAIVLADALEVAFVDDADFELVSPFRWRIRDSRNGVQYAHA